MNLRFEYLYRDAGNFKQFGSAIFALDDGQSVAAAKTRICRALIDGTYFTAEEVGLPSLRFADYLPHVDHGWHEFVDLTEMAGENHEAPVGELDTFLSALERTCR